VFQLCPANSFIRNASIKIQKSKDHRASLLQMMHALGRRATLFRLLIVLPAALPLQNYPRRRVVAKFVAREQTAQLLDLSPAGKAFV
jgi:hypothetical protein